MPSTLIEIRRPTSDDEADALISAVHESLVVAFQIPQGDRTIRLRTYEPRHLVRGLGPQRADQYTRVTIDCFAGRSVEAKRRLYLEIVERLERLGTPRALVSILLRESPLENWGLDGGRPACDIDLGFAVDV